MCHRNCSIKEHNLQIIHAVHRAEYVTQWGIIFLNAQSLCESEHLHTDDSIVHCESCCFWYLLNLAENTCLHHLISHRRNFWGLLSLCGNFCSPILLIPHLTMHVRKLCSGPVFTNILILRIVLFLEFFSEFYSFLRIILRIRILTIWNVLKSPQFCPI